MKKILLAACFALASTAMQAQVWLGGSLGLNFQSADEVDMTTFTIAPEIGYKLNDKWDIAIGISEAYTNVNPDKGKSTSTNFFSVNPYARYTFASTGKVSFFLDGGFIVGTGDYYYDGDSYDDETSWGIGIRPGIKVDLTEHVALVARLGYFGYKHEGGPDVSSFGLCIDNNNISFGAYYAF